MGRSFSHWLLLVSAFLYPFVLVPSFFGVVTDHPGAIWALPKVVFLLVVALLGLGEARRAFHTPFGRLMGIYLGLVLLSSFWPPHVDGFMNALLGSPTRVDGALYQVGLVLFGLLTYRLFREEPEAIRDAMQVLLWGTALQSALLVLQRLGLEFVGPLLGGAPFRTPVGTIGHPSMAAGLLVPGVLLGLGLWAERKKTLFFLLALLVALGLGVTEGRAGLFGLALALGVWTFLRREGRFMLAGASLLLAAFLAPFLIPDRQGFSKEVADPKTGLTRVVIWKLAWEGIRAVPGEPLLGGGPEAFKKALATQIPFEGLLEFYRLEYSWPEGAKVKEIKPLWTQETPWRERVWLVRFEGWPGTEKKGYRVNLDKAHNLFLDRWLSYGLIAGLLWVYLYLGGAVRAWGRGVLGQAVAVSLLGIFAYYLLWFPVPQVEPLHVLLIGAAFALGEVGEQGVPVRVLLDPRDEEA